MSLSDEFKAELDTAVQNTIPDTKEEKAEEELSQEEESGSNEDDRISEVGTETEGETDQEEVGEAGGDSERDSESGKEEQPEGISEELLERAVRSGISLSQARKFPSEIALRGSLDALDRAKERYENQVEPKKEEKKKEEKEEPDPFADLPELDPDTYEPEVIKMFDSLVGIVKKQQETIKGFENNQASAAEAAKAAEARELEAWFDAQVAGLGEEFEESLGKGRYSELSKTSPQFYKRDKVAEQMSVLFRGYQALGLTAPRREELFETAVGIILADELQDVEDKKVSESLKTRQKYNIQRAGGQKTKKALSATEEAVEALRERFPGISK